MSSRLAEHRIRAAASQVVGLDIRGPVSQALVRAGVTLPLADAPDETTAPGVTPTQTASGTAARPRARS